jgi:integrase
VLKATKDRRNGARWSLGLSLGLRQGEALGLRWSYVDLDAGTVRVWRQLSRANWRHGCADSHACGERFHRKPCPKGCDKHRHRDDCSADCLVKSHTCPEPCPPRCRKHAARCLKRRGGGFAFRQPNGKSKRTIVLPAELVPLLKAHRAAQLSERLKAGSIWQDHDLVFCPEDGRQIPRDDDWRDWWTTQGRRRSRRRVHDGRHTAGTPLRAERARANRAGDPRTFPDHDHRAVHARGLADAGRRCEADG